MSHYAKRKLTRTARPAYRTQGWALGVLVEQQAVTECDHHRTPAGPFGSGFLERGA
jgi:hypothetical protein